MKREIKINLIDYKNAISTFTIDSEKMKKFMMARIELISGDEVLTIYFENGKTRLDSSNSRFQNHYDDEIEMYNIEEFNVLLKLPTKANEICLSYRRMNMLRKKLMALRGEIKK